MKMKNSRNVQIINDFEILEKEIFEQNRELFLEQNFTKEMFLWQQQQL